MKVILQENCYLSLQGSGQIFAIFALVTPLAFKLFVCSFSPSPPRGSVDRDAPYP